jgi:hypothetical protein
MIREGRLRGDKEEIVIRRILMTFAEMIQMSIDW